MTTTEEVVEAPGVAPLALSEAGSWLCSQDAFLRELVERIGAWDPDMGPKMRVVRDALIEHDRIRAQEDAARAVGAIFRPNRPEQRELAVMAPSEIGRLRMLATLAPGTYRGPGLQFCIDDLATFDKSGKNLVLLWLEAVRIGLVG